ncbi:hypothetical protein [uncultured Dubosiella sp.]|uniref:hypothetical protein n=2 Tax=uncultured Dubosiella sp. TaxID=1937011 RepID=UPI0025857890|nr:hypothetical protein [uncultured Dubosiella sp.]
MDRRDLFTIPTSDVFYVYFIITQEGLQVWIGVVSKQLSKRLWFPDIRTIMKGKNNARDETLQRKVGILVFARRANLANLPQKHGRHIAEDPNRHQPIRMRLVFETKKKREVVFRTENDCAYIMIKRMKATIEKKVRREIKIANLFGLNNVFVVKKEEIHQGSEYSRNTQKIFFT